MLGMGKIEFDDPDEEPTAELTDADVANRISYPDTIIRRGVHLTNDVTQADLTKYPDHQLQGRLAYYERQYTFENKRSLREEFKREVERTRIEINRRKMYAAAEARRVFEL